MNQKIVLSKTNNYYDDWTIVEKVVDTQFVEFDFSIY